MSSIFVFVLFTADEAADDEDRRYLMTRDRLLPFARWPQLDVPEYRPACSCLGPNHADANPAAFQCRNVADVAPDFWPQLGLDLKSPDPACAGCKGSGRHDLAITSNPNGKFDYWGPRSFKAWVAGREDLDDDEDCGPVAQMLAAFHHQPISPSGELAWLLPHAIVTPGLQWFEDPALSRRDAAAEFWPATAQSILAQHGGGLLAATSVHT